MRLIRSLFSFKRLAFRYVEYDASAQTVNDTLPVSCPLSLSLSLFLFLPWTLWQNHIRAHIYILSSNIIGQEKMQGCFIVHPPSPLDHLHCTNVQQSAHTPWLDPCTGNKKVLSVRLAWIPCAPECASAAWDKNQHPPSGTINPLSGPHRQL